MAMKNRINWLIFTFYLFLVTIHCAGTRSNPKFSEPRSSNNKNRVTEGRFYTSDEHFPLIKGELTKAIESYLGVPYRWGGRTRQGMDCSGFVLKVYQKALNLNLPHSAKIMYRLGDSVPVKDLRFGDLVFFKNIESYGISHVGIYVGNNEFAHASTTQGVIISKLSEKYYRKRFVGVKRILRK